MQRQTKIKTNEAPGNFQVIMTNETSRNGIEKKNKNICILSTECMKQTSVGIDGPPVEVNKIEKQTQPDNKCLDGMVLTKQKVNELGNKRTKPRFTCESTITQIA